jgi:ribosomal protein L37AE/L43A
MMDFKIILCPYCGKPLESTKYSSDDIIQCKHCAQSFKKGFQKEESISIAIEEQKI